MLKNMRFTLSFSQLMAGYNLEAKLAWGSAMRPMNLLKNRTRINPSAISIVGRGIAANALENQSHLGNRAFMPVGTT